MVKSKARQPLEYYLGLKYPVTVVPSEDGGFVAHIKDLPGCITQGDSLEEAMAMIDDAREVWLRGNYAEDNPIPEPRSTEGYSGKFVVRTPKSLHRDLAERAAEEGVSLNQFVVSLLASRVRA